MTPGNDVHPAAVDGYTAAAGTYVKGRPEYPVEVDKWLRRDLSLGPGKIVLDLGAGTGKFTSRLLATEAQVIAIEPLPAMLEQLIQRYPEVMAKSGTAEHIPLPDASVDAVICAQSFHWFATAAAVREVHRVLKPGGWFGLIWNVRDERVSWVATLSEILTPFEGDTPRYWHQSWRDVFPAPGFSELQEQHFSNGHSGPPGQVIVDRTMSVSFIAALPQAAQKHVEAQVRELIAATPELSGKAIVTFPYETAAFRCTKLPDTK